MSGNTKKLLAVNYFGGKFTWVDYILPFLPQPISEIPHFVDMFTGSMSMLLNKPYSKIDTGNDKNNYLVNFFQCLREDPEKLIELLKLTPVSRHEYKLCWHKSEDPFEDARRFYVRARQSFGGNGTQKHGSGWSFDKTTSRRTYASAVSRWHNSIESLWEVVNKLTHIQVESKDFRDLWPEVEKKNNVIYLDPPYWKEARNSHSDYIHEFTLEDHEDLADLARSSKAKVIISHYACELMDRLYGDWYMFRLKPKKNNIRNGIVQECLWTNYEPTGITGSIFNGNGDNTHHF